jgi:formylglycine-generating enzyme required for sulfatase activity
MKSLRPVRSALRLAALAGAAWVYVPPGTFEMGSPESEVGRDRWENLHTVTLTRGFVMEATETTQAEFLARRGYDSSAFDSCGATCPAESLTWHEAAACCNALSRETGRAPCYVCDAPMLEVREVRCTPNAAWAVPYDCPGYRLPSEAEWEYAARAGTTTATYNGDLEDARVICDGTDAFLEPIAWFCGNSAARPHPAGAKAPNAWGLYDMLGNVWDWIGDFADPWAYYPSGPATDPWGPLLGEIRDIRGGSWSNIAGFLRAAKRKGESSRRQRRVPPRAVGPAVASSSRRRGAAGARAGRGDRGSPTPPAGQRTSVHAVPS